MPSKKMVVSCRCSVHGVSDTPEQPMWQQMDREPAGEGWKQERTSWRSLLPIAEETGCTPAAEISAAFGFTAARSPWLA